MKEKVSPVVLLREKEQQTIKAFLSSNEKILHIYGNPGTGKTFITGHLLKNTKHTYYNYLQDNSFINKTNSTKIIIIDEFDRFYENMNTAAIRFLNKHEEKKIITLANKCIFEDSLHFPAYTSNEIFILVKTICKCNDENVLNFISKKFSINGDLRRAIDYYFRGIKESEENFNKENINHRMVKEVIKMNVKRKNVFEKYVEKCKNEEVPYLGRNEFFIIYEMYI